MLGIGIENMGQSTRLYSHCAKQGESGSVVIFGFNMGLNITKLEIGKLQRIEEYVLRPANNDLQSQQVLLNNRVLRLVEGKTMPNLKPVVVVGDVIFMEAGTIGFWVLPHAGNRNC